jgi:hypothetical protein
LRHRVLECQSGKLLCATIENWIGGDDEPTNLQFNHFRKGRLEITFAAGIETVELQSTVPGGCLQGFHSDVYVCPISWVHQHGKTFGVGDHFMQQFRPFR